MVEWLKAPEQVIRRRVPLWLILCPDDMLTGAVIGQRGDMVLGKGIYRCKKIRIRRSVEHMQDA